MNILKFLESAYKAPDGDVSIKRILGTICIVSLVVAMFLSGYYVAMHFDPNLISAVTWVGASCIIGTVAEKFSPQLTSIADKIKSRLSEEGENN